jgi:hypothetical protein
MNGEDFRRIVLDYFEIETRRHRDIMTSNQNVMDAIAALSTSITQLNTTIITAIADMGTGGDAARAGFVTALQGVADQITAAQTELTTAIAAQTASATGPAPQP